MSEKTLQSLSGLYFGAFATLHLLNHSSFLVGDNVGKVARHKVAMDALRRVYQHPLAEGILALSVTIHGFIAIREYQRRNFPEGSEKDDNKTWAQFLGNRKKLLSSQNLHRLTGWVLMLQVPVHVFSTRIDQYLHGLTDGDVQAVVMAVRALPTAMLPYLVVLGSFGAYHLISGGGSGGKSALRAIDGEATGFFIRARHLDRGARGDGDCARRFRGLVAPAPRLLLPHWPSRIAKVLLTLARFHHPDANRRL